MLQNLTSNITRPVGKGSAANAISEECYKELKEDIEAVSERVDALSDNVVTQCILADRGNITTLNSDSIEADNIITDGLSTNSAIVTNADIDHITNKDISTECVTTNTATIDTITADTATIDTASINHINLTSATIPVLSATNVTASCINACNANAATLTTDNLTSNNTTSTTADIATLTSDNISATSSVTAPVVNSTSVNAQNVTASNKVEAKTIDAVKGIIHDIENTGIKASGTINLDPELPSTNDYYQLYIPEFDNFYATFYGKSSDKKLAISVVGTKKTAIVQASQDTLGLITDVEFKRNSGIYIKLRADEELHYHIIFNSENYSSDSITVTLNGTNTAEYSYSVDKTGFYIFRGYNSNDISAIIPVNASIHAIEADEQHYTESTTDVLKIYDKLYVVDTVDPAGTAITLSSGEDNQYLSIFDTGAVDADGCAILHPTYKTPVDSTSGCLSNSSCLITERAVSTWNGTSNVGYPISHLNETTCAHGDLNVACSVTSDSITADTATISCADITNETVTNSTIDNATVTCAVVTEETVTGSTIDTATITDATITDATIENAAIDELNANTVDVAGDVKIAGDLYVDGTTHTVSQEDIEVEGDTLALRVNNPTSLSAGQVSGLLINKYNGTDNLTIAADCTGTARVGTGTGADTSYTNIAYDDVTHKWYDYDGLVYTEMSTQPTGTITSYTDKVVDAPYTRYATITFTAIDIVTLEPILTRAEEADMEDGYLTKWDATNSRAVTCGTSCTHDLCVFCNACIRGSVRADASHFGSAWINELAVNGDAIITGRTFGTSACFTGNVNTRSLLVRENTTLTGTTCACDDVTIDCNLTVKEDIINCGNTEVCGDLTVHGDITIGGDITLDKIGTVSNTDNCAQYLTFVADNNNTMASEQVRTDADITYNPYTDTLTVPVICATSCVTAPLVCGNLCGTATTAICSCCTYISQNGTNASYPLVFTSDITDGQKELYTAPASSLTYNPITGILTASICGNASSATNVYRVSSNTGFDYDIYLANGCTTTFSGAYVSSSCRLRYCNTTGALRITNSSGTVAGSISATTFCGSLSGTATNATCFNGCTYACACANIRSGLTGCTGTVTSVNVSVNGTSGTAVTTSGTVTLTGVKGAGTCVYNSYCLSAFSTNDDRPMVLSTVSGTNTGTLGTSTVCSVTYNPTNGVLKATTFCGAFSGTVTNATCFGGCTYACAKADIRNYTPSLATCASSVCRCGWSSAYDFDVSLFNGCTSTYNTAYVSASCRLRYCNTTGALRITNSSGTIAGSVSAGTFNGNLCGLAACTSKVAVNCCTESCSYGIPFITSNTSGYATLGYDGSLEYDPDEQCLGVSYVCSFQVCSNYALVYCTLCARQRHAYGCICQYGSTTANSACLLQKDTTACTTELIASFSCTTLQCNLFNALVCNVNLCRNTNYTFTPAHGFFLDCNNCAEATTSIRWTCSSRKIEFYNNANSVVLTLNRNCTAAICAEGSVKVFGKCGTTAM